MLRIELITAAGVEPLAWWPASDPDTAEALREHYRERCRLDEGFVAVRVRLERPKETSR